MATTYQRAANQRTDAGALSPLAEGLTTFVESRIKIDVNGREALVTDKDSGISEALMHWSVTQARVFVVRVTLSFLYATGVLAFLGFLSTLGADSAAGDHESDRKKRYLCALSVVVNLVAVAHYKLITKIRSYDFGVHHKAEVFANLEWTAFTKHNDKVAIGVEMAVDSIRHSDWLITLIFLIYKIYYLAGTDSNGAPKTGDIFETPAAAAGCAVLMVCLSAIVRIGTDEIWDWHKNVWPTVIAVVLWLSSLLLMILLIADIDTAVEANKGIINVDLYKSFYLSWIGYPIVSLLSIITRFFMSCRNGESYKGETPQWLTFTKDLSYGFLDSWSKGVFALWTAYTAFNMHLLEAPSATSLN